MEEEDYGYTEYPEVESEGGTRQWMVSYEYLLDYNANRMECGGKNEHSPCEDSWQNMTYRPSF